ncbi:MAG: cobalt-precorrin-5B (C(1))-methyltransferase CbiD [Verrucomicrobiota bacterium]
MKPFDLKELAPNGLKRGYTTGSCATAGVKAALLRFLYDEKTTEVEFVLPDQSHTLRIPVEETELLPNGASARVIKDAGDDPDRTHGAAILVEVRTKETPGIEFQAGPGVGVVRQGGLQIPIGEPAINPVPRLMIEHTIEAVLADAEIAPAGFVVRIGCENGEAIAKRTFNPRLGIEGGISILGTTGIVEPKSLAAFKASIEIYINVAVAGDPEEVVFSPGTLGQKFARNHLELDIRRVVQTSNFVGFSLDHLSDRLEENNQQLPKLWIVGHPGKLAKLVDDHWDTHSQNSPPAIGIIERIAKKMGITPDASNTVEGLAKSLGDHTELWDEIAERTRAKVAERVRSVSEIQVRLFSMSGKLLNATCLPKLS